MVTGFGTHLGAGHRHYSDNSESGWNGWLYPVLFIVLPIVAGLMVIALIACNVYEYYQKKKRLEQYRHYSEHLSPEVKTGTEKPLEVNGELVDSTGYNEAQYTYNTIFGNYMLNQENKAPVRPLSGWVVPQMHRHRHSQGGIPLILPL